MSKFVGTGPSSYKKKNLPGRGFTKLRNAGLMHSIIQNVDVKFYII